MMHDGIRADVMSALYATTAAERTTLDVDSVGEKATAVVDHLRARGHAALISGAGPSVLVLVRRGRAHEVALPATFGGWTRLQPGIPRRGAQVIAC